MHFISPFLLLKSSSRSRYHTRCRCMGTTTTAYARGMTIQPHLPARKPPRRRRILPLAPTPAAIRGHASYVYFFFVPFLTNFTETLFTPRAGSSNPRLSIHNPHHRALPLEPRKSRRRHCLIRRHASKDMFFSFLFFRSFSDQCYRDSLSHAPGPQTPASLPHNPHPRALPLKPRKSCRRHCLHSQAHK